MGDRHSYGTVGELASALANLDQGAEIYSTAVSRICLYEQDDGKFLVAGVQRREAKGIEESSSRA